MYQTLIQALQTDWFESSTQSSKVIHKSCSIDYPALYHVVPPSSSYLSCCCYCHLGRQRRRMSSEFLLLRTTPESVPSDMPIRTKPPSHPLLPGGSSPSPQSWDTFPWWGEASTPWYKCILDTSIPLLHYHHHQYHHICHCRFWIWHRRCSSHLTSSSYLQSCNRVY